MPLRAVDKVQPTGKGGAKRRAFCAEFFERSRRAAELQGKGVFAGVGKPVCQLFQRFAPASHPVCHRHRNGGLHARIGHQRLSTLFSFQPMQTGDQGTKDAVEMAARAAASVLASASAPYGSAAL